MEFSETKGNMNHLVSKYQHATVSEGEEATEDEDEEEINVEGGLKVLQYTRALFLALITWEWCPGLSA